MNKQAFQCGAVFGLSCLALSTVSLALAQQTQLPFTGKITTDAVNVRSGPGINFEILHKLDSGALVLVEEETHGWKKIKLPYGAKAYILREFLVQDEQYPAVGKVIGNRINIRAGAGTRFNVLGQVNNGDEVHILGIDAEWVHIYPLTGGAAWVSHDLVVYFGNADLYATIESREKSDFLAGRGQSVPVLAAVSAKPEKSASGTPASQSAASVPARAAATVPSSPASEQVTVEGQIRQLGRFFRRLGTHKLVVDNKTHYFLAAGDTIQLDDYLYHTVRLSGTREPQQRGGISLLVVTAIEKIQ